MDLTASIATAQASRSAARTSVIWLLAVVLAGLMCACSPRDEDGTVLTIYSGRTEAMVGPLIDRFAEQENVRVRVQYADTSQLAATLLEEGARSRADVFVAQDVSTLGLLEREGRLAPLSPEILDRVDARYRSSTGGWVGVSGRARVLSYHPDRVSAEELPSRLEDLLDAHWQGRLGWAPTNASFQAQVTALVAHVGEEEARGWIAGMVSQAPRAYPSNTPAVLAVNAGEVDAVLTNHYYLHRLRAEQGDRMRVQNHYLRSGDAGSFISMSGVGVVTGTSREALAQRFIAFLLEDEAQRHFADVNFEFPLATGASGHPDLPSTESLRAPPVEAGVLEDLETTLRLLREARAVR